MAQKKLADYYADLRKNLQDRKGPFLYRGQESASWELQSSAVRRLANSKVVAEKQPVAPAILIEYHKEELLKPSSLRGWRKDSSGQRLGDLELLAKLRHYGAAVCLLDFTTRFDIALWFACQEVKKENESSNGRVFVVDVDAAMDDFTMGKIEFDDLSLGIDVVLNRQSEKKDKKNPIESAKNGMDTEPKFWYWEPETLIGRMLSQESRFLFGPNDIPAGRFLFDIKIEEGDKEGLLWELKRLQGLRPETIFSDIHGFADANAHGKIVSKDYQKTPQRKVASKASKEADAESLEKESTQEHKKKQ